MSESLEHSDSDGRRPHLNEFGRFTCEKAVDRSRKDLKPTLKMFPGKLDLLVQLDVDLQWVSTVASIIARAEKKRFPKIADDREVMFQVELYNVGEYGSDLFIRDRVAIEKPHQLVDVLTVLHVSFHKHY